MDSASRGAVYGFVQAEINGLVSKNHKLIDFAETNEARMAPAGIALGEPVAQVQPEPFMQVQAKLWTDVEISDRLCSHLITLFFTWDFHYTPLIPRDRFITDLRRGEESSQFCTKFLVNALLALESVESPLLYFVCFTNC